MGVVACLGGPPWGHDDVNSTRNRGCRYDVDLDEAEVIKDATKRVLAGESINSIIKWLNASRVPTVTGGAMEPHADPQDDHVHVQRRDRRPKSDPS